MFAVDASVWIDLFADAQTQETKILRDAVHKVRVFMPPVALAEVLSDPKFPRQHKAFLDVIELLPVANGYWERAGLMRARLIAKKLKPKLPDTLISQSCIDHDVPLLTRDKGFAVFEKYCGLKIYKAG